MTAARRQPGPRYDTLIALLRTADTLWDASRVLFAQWRLSPSQFNVLNLLGHEPAGLSQSALGRQLVMHRSNVTGLVNRLEQRRLVARREDQADRRAWRVVLTPAGRRLLDDVLPHYYGVAEDVWSGLSLAQVQKLNTTLRRLEDHSATLAAQWIAPPA